MGSIRDFLKRIDAKQERLKLAKAEIEVLIEDIASIPNSRLAERLSSRVTRIKALLRDVIKWN